LRAGQSRLPAGGQDVSAEETREARHPGVDNPFRLRSLEIAIPKRKQVLDRQVDNLAE